MSVSEVREPSEEAMTGQDLDALADLVADRILERLGVAPAAGQPNDRPPWTVKELHRELGISERTLRDRLATGEIPSYRLGGRRLIAAHDVAEYVQERRRRPKEA